MIMNTCTSALLLVGDGYQHTWSIQKSFKLVPTPNDSFLDIGSLTYFGQLDLAQHPVWSERAWNTRFNSFFSCLACFKGSFMMLKISKIKIKKKMNAQSKIRSSILYQYTCAGISGFGCSLFCCIPEHLKTEHKTNWLTTANLVVSAISM